MSPASHADRDHSESPDTIRAGARLCDDDGTVRSGAMHHGQDYECTGSAHFDGIPIECTNPVHADRDHSEAPKTDILTAARREAERLTEAIYRQEAAIDRARMERAQAEDAETAATERAEAAEAERDRARSLAATLEAQLAQVRSALLEGGQSAYARWGKAVKVIIEGDA